MDGAAEKIATDSQVLENLQTGDPGWRSICQVHRDIYQLVKDDDRAVRLLIEAHRMAKRMDHKLRQYKEGKA